MVLVTEMAPAISESATNIKSQQSGPISHIVWTDLILNFHQYYGFKFKNLKV